jgi:hypothetical protein
MISWPELHIADWRDTYITLQLYTQIVGKIRLALTPKLNQWWNVALYVTPRGLTTSTMPYRERTLSIDLDFVDHRVAIVDRVGHVRSLPLAPSPVCAFHNALFGDLGAMGIRVDIGGMPQEWGAFDLAVSRFNGRRAPLRKGKVDRDAYDEEVISLGFWPGDPWTGATEAMFYSYTVPEPPGLPSQSVRPESASFGPTLKEFLLPYDDVRRSQNPAQSILDFAQSTYDAGAPLGGWDRAALAYP